jgi:hypothetical protein
VALLGSLLVGPSAHAKPRAIKVHAARTRFYFHASGARTNQLATATFDTKKSTGNQVSYAPGSQLVPRATWTGAVRGTITTLKVDFWQQAPVGQAVFGLVNYDVVLHMGSNDYALGDFTVHVPLDGTPTRVVHLYTPPVPYNDSPLPLKISSSRVTLQLAGHYQTDPTNEYKPPGAGFEADPTLIAYDSMEFPSGFEINTPWDPTVF